MENLKTKPYKEQAKSEQKELYVFAFDFTKDIGEAKRYP